MFGAKERDIQVHGLRSAVMAGQAKSVAYEYDWQVVYCMMEATVVPRHYQLYAHVYGQAVTLLSISMHPFYTCHTASVDGAR